MYANALVVLNWICSLADKWMHEFTLKVCRETACGFFNLFVVLCKKNVLNDSLKGDYDDDVAPICSCIFYYRVPNDMNHEQVYFVKKST